MRLTRGKLADAMPFLLEHHYLRRRTADPMFVFQWVDDAGVTQAVAVFCAPSNRYFGKGSVELSRLVRLPSYDGPLTQFLSRCLSELRKDPRRLKFLLSYADSTVGHRGVVYQALSGIHVSVSKGHTLWKNDVTGEVVSNRSMDQRRPENREGFVRVKTGLKYLYVWPLHEKREKLLTRFSWKPLPYPKA